MRSSNPQPTRHGRRQRELKHRRRRASALLAIAAGSAAIGLWLVGCAGRAVQSSAPPPVVSVFPIPGGRVASPETQIAFRGVPISRVENVVVTGSRSGRHAGRLAADSDGRGGSFLPSRPFVAGEVVTVRTGVHIRDAVGGTFRFTVATPAGSISAMPPVAAGRVPGDELMFQSRPDLSPASVEITKQASEPGDADDILITPQLGPTQNGAMILDGNGQLVWFQPVPSGERAADLQVQSYQGKRVLTWWQGYEGAGVGAGEDVIDDASYRQVAVVHAANGLSADLHDFRLTSQGTALITAYYPVYWNATDVHLASRQTVLDAVVQEIDINTGLLLFQWDSLDHVPLTDTYEPLVKSAGLPYDYLHVNSIQLENDGNLLISGRNTWAAYEVDHQTGQVVWTLGGKNSSYKLAPGVQFAFQHDVRLHIDSDPTVTMFDDGAGPPKLHEQSRGITVRLNSGTRTATLVREELHTPPLSAAFEGDVQALPDGNTFVGWGQQPYFTEFNPQGQMVFDGRFVGNNSSYRAYRSTWIGTPSTVPSVSASTTGADTNVYVSWNGATQVTAWRVLAGVGAGALQAVTTASKTGFETQVTIPAQPYVQVQALDSAGAVLATSSVVHAT
jgi:arylsulfotransferase ASST